MNAKAAASTAELPNLDALRAVAVLLVLADHVLEIVSPSLGWSHNDIAYQLGRLGVLLFFVHTSYVLMASLDRLGTGWRAAMAFYVRRVFRIYPLAIACILLVIAAGVPELPWREYVEPTTADLIANFTLTQNLFYARSVLAPLWSLPVEVQMYLLLPLIFVMTRRVSDMRVVAAIWLAAFVGSFLIPAISMRLTTAEFAPYFIAGIVAYGMRGRKPIYRGVMWPLLLLALLAAYVVIETLVDGIHHPTLQALFCLLVGMSLPEFMQIRSRAFNAVTHAVAKYSYGIYLFHCVALWLGFFRLAPAAPLAVKVAISTAALIGLSVAGYHLIESPMIRLGVRLSARVRPPVILLCQKCQSRPQIGPKP